MYIPIYTLLPHVECTIMTVVITLLFIIYIAILWLEKMLIILVFHVSNYKCTNNWGNNWSVKITNSFFQCKKLNQTPNTSKPQKGIKFRNTFLTTLNNKCCLTSFSHWPHQWTKENTIINVNETNKWIQIVNHSNRVAHSSNLDSALRSDCSISQ